MPLGAFRLNTLANPGAAAGGGSTFIDAVDLDGNDYWYDGSYSDSGSGTDFTASFHYKGTGAATFSYLIAARRDGTNDRFGVGINTDGAVWFVTADAVRSPNARWYFHNAGDDAITDDVWHHVLIMTDTTSTSNNKIYIDGVSQTITNAYTNGTDAWNWGAYNRFLLGAQWSGSGWQQYVNGEIAQVWGDNSYNSIDDFWDSGEGLALDLGSDGTGSGLSQPMYYFNGNTTSTPAISTNGGTETISFTEYGDPSDSSQGPEVI
jgi:hypothetical protein